MGACLSDCGTAGSASDDVPHAPSRRRSRARSKSYAFSNNSHRGSDRAGSSITVQNPVPDFGISSLYRVLQLLGEGGTGQTWMCQDVRTARRVAIKFIPRPLAKVLVPMVSQEIQLQAQLSEGCLGLVRMESALLTRSHLGLVMEYVDGGTLTQYVTRRTATRFERGGLHLVEDEARYFFRQLINAVEYLHKSHVAHRDLKMCNVVLTTRRPPTLKLCDFGFAKGWDESSVMHTRIGTPVYMSPQLIASKQDGKAYSATAADVWACGVLLFAMLLGRFPYDHTGHPDPNSSGAHGEVLSEQMKAIESGWESNPRVAPHIALLSDECRSLLGQLLNTDEAKRITIPAIRAHPWFNQPLPDHFADALREAEERQARLDAAMEAAPEEQTKKRNSAVHDLVVLAGQEYGSTGGAAGATGAANVGHASGPFSAIFESEREGECPGTPRSQCRAKAGGGCGVTGFDGSQALKKVSSKATTSVGEELTPALSLMSKGTEADVLVVDLTAVARRTKSDGLLLVHPAASGLGEAGCGCEGDSCCPLGLGLGDSGEDTEDGGVDSSCNGGSGAGEGGAGARLLQEPVQPQQAEVARAAAEPPEQAPGAGQAEAALGSHATPKPNAAQPQDHAHAAAVQRAQGPEPAAPETGAALAALKEASEVPRSPFMSGGCADGHGKAAVQPEAGVHLRAETPAGSAGGDGSAERQ